MGNKTCVWNFVLMMDNLLHMGWGNRNHPFYVVLMMDNLLHIRTAGKHSICSYLLSTSLPIEYILHLIAALSWTRSRRDRMSDNRDIHSIVLAALSWTSNRDKNSIARDALSWTINIRDRTRLNTHIVKIRDRPEIVRKKPAFALTLDLRFPFALNWS